MSEEKRPEAVPYIVYEHTMARFERTIKRLVIALCIAVFAGLITNLAWMYVFNSYDIVTEDVTVDSNDGGNANYIGASGVINNGERESQKEDKEKEQPKQSQGDAEED